MTSARLAASQEPRSRKIRMALTFIFPTQEDGDAWNSFGYGVTTTSTTPTKVEDFAAHVENLSTLATSRQVQRRAWALGSPAAYFDQWTGSGSKALDSNYAAGRYLWAFVAGSTDGGVTPLLAVSSSYHIAA